MIRLGIVNLVAKTPDYPLTLSRQVLCETQAWCSSRTSLAHNLRSPGLDPSDSLNIDIPHLEDIDRWVRDKYENYRLAVEELARKRSVLLSGIMTSPENAISEATGKLLLYFPLETVSDGAAEASSKGFFDIEDAPPWDTWLAYFEGEILTWVPDSMISLAQAGIDANPVDCIHWAEKRNLQY
jgi:hypothetical protein